MNATQTIIRMVFDRWSALLKSFDSMLDAYSDEQLAKEIAPCKNRGIYLLGHLVAVHDDMLPLLDLGENEYPELLQIFVKSPDKSIEPIPSAGELRIIWKKQLASLAIKLASFSADEWFEKHTAVTAEDFLKEPHRNKLNIILTRTTHLAYHAGQFALLK